MPKRMGYVLQKPMPPMADGTELEIGKEIPDFDNPDVWPNKDVLLRLGWVKIEEVDESKAAPVKQAPSQWPVEDFTVTELEKHITSFDLETVRRLAWEESKRKPKPRAGIVKLLEQRVNTPQARDFTVDELSVFVLNADLETLNRLKDQEEQAKPPREDAVEVLDKRLLDFADPHPEDGGASNEIIKQALVDKSEDELVSMINDSDNPGELERAIALETAGQNRDDIKEEAQKRIDAILGD